MDLSKFIKIDENSRVPKYQQIIDSIIHNISVGNFTMDQKIPSINMFSEEFYLSRDTVEKAYSILKERNIITSIRGKGFYISRTKLISKVNILFLVNKLSSYKMRTYNHFIESIGANSHTDIHIYHCEENLFLNLLEKYKSVYDYFVIMPHFKTENQKHLSYTEDIINSVKKIPRNKLVVLDNTKFGEKIDGNFIEVVQDFENDIYYALKEALPKIQKKYEKIILIYHEKAVYPYPRRILHGFKKFCLEYNLDFEVLDEIYDDMVLKKGDLFITIEEADLVDLVKQVREIEYKLGEDIGVISYNDTPLKELLGITVISTDFKVMGQTAANMILNNQRGKVKVPFNFIDRDSL
ncbi:transcriptional regulator, GntR family [Lutibacter agarilyticus]|uniref:Transcriptional regulator, GntR family n=1 Tax=Lutibacter agarilyticus TaxID=1109740 RepID=A0A238YJV6_9FLAO|nr:GntR family transcriptional regulator [Lutibacter agarilyticus]SNR70913.1 transcriptional regulator, GntR family [Lutibacter agarilyticus]